MLDLIVLVSVSSLWAIGFYFIRVGVRNFSLLLFSSYRLVVAYFSFFLSLVIAYFPMKSVKKDVALVSSNLPKYLMHFVVMGVLNFTIPFLLSSYAQKCVTLGLSSIVETAIPLFTQLFAHIMTQDEKITWKIAAGLFLGFVGVIVAVIPQLSGEFTVIDYKSTALSIGALVLAAAGYGFCNVYYKLYLKTLSVFANGCGQTLIATNVSLLTLICIESPKAIYLEMEYASRMAHISAVALGFAGIYLAYLGQFYLISTKGSVYAGLTGFLMPITAVILGGTIESEWAELPKGTIACQMSGLTVTLSGIALTMYAQNLQAKVRIDESPGSANIDLKAPLNSGD